MNGKAHDFLSRQFNRLAYRVHPIFGRLYENHQKFFNDGFVELICLIIANTAIAFLSYSFIGVSLALLSLFLVTPVTFTIKYFLHKLWVWAPHDS